MAGAFAGKIQGVVWVVNEYTSEMPFGKCVNNQLNFTASAPQGGSGYSDKAFANACLPNNTNTDRRQGINGTAGYVIGG